MSRNFKILVRVCDDSVMAPGIVVQGRLQETASNTDVATTVWDGWVDDPLKECFAVLCDKAKELCGLKGGADE